MREYSFHNDQTGSYPSLGEVQRCLAMCGAVEHKEAEGACRIAWRREEQENTKTRSCRDGGMHLFPCKGVIVI